MNDVKVLRKKSTEAGKANMIKACNESAASIGC